ncbi:MAG: DNA mismatch repair endonuclease MutL [Clostridia bacterium]|nr:DNA mismatch repair endonuclease MutL [Deltaproteobacteria bacterium]
MTAIEAAIDEPCIHLLPSNLIDKIAAGEVIERPASAVKELLENSIDAGARAIRVTLAAGGLGRLCVEDDGRGMSPADARNCVLRHATSKLAHEDDLFCIRTLGFRGEALSSIAAVSRLTLTTRRAQDTAATRIVCVAGEVEIETLVGAPIGTCVDVEDLFFNTPARRKFMRSPATEQAHIVEAALRVILGAGDCGIVVTSGERRLLDVPEDASENTRLVAALGTKVREVHGFEGGVDGVRVSGYITAPENDRADAKGMWFFVNGRFVRDRMIQRAVLDGYRSLVGGRYPVCVIHVELAADAVDVNVHPQKTEVRFSDSQAVFRAVSSALTQVLSTTPWVQGTLGARLATEAYFEKAPAFEYRRHRQSTLEARDYRDGVYGTHADMASYAARDSVVLKRPMLPENRELPLQPVKTGFFESLRPVGQALGDFLVCESAENDGELVIIDRRAACERIAYDQLRLQVDGDGVVMQQLLFPETLEASGAMHAFLEARWHTLATYGFEVEPVGPGRFAVRAIPVGLNADAAGAMVEGLVHELGEVEGADATGREVLLRVMSRCACHAELRSDVGPANESVRSLLAELDLVDFAASCHHGRPVVHRITRRELGKLFRTKAS